MFEDKRFVLGLVRHAGIIDTYYLLFLVYFPYGQSFPEDE